MARGATERIKHYNDILVQHHRFVGGTILSGYGLRSRIFAWHDKEKIYAWGAEYTPLPGLLAVLAPIIAREGQDEELGIPGSPTCEAWLSIARKADAGRATNVTRYEYSTGTLRGLPPHVAVGNDKISVPFSDINTTHIRAGIGYWRGIPSFPQITSAPVHAERLANALQLATSQVIAQTGRP